MSESMSVVTEDLARLRSVVADSVVPTVAGARGATPGTRVPSGTFSQLEVGPVGEQIATGIADRLEARLREFQERFEDVADRLDQTRLEYERTEAANVDATSGVEV